MQLAYGTMAPSPDQIVATLTRRGLMAFAVFAVGYALELPPVLLLPYAVTLLIVIIVTLSSGKGRLVVRPRYVILNNDVVIYLARVVTVTVSADELSLRTNDARMAIQRDEFPSNARKAEKIRRHQTTKYNKATDAILHAVRQHAPDASIIDKRKAAG